MLCFYHDDMDGRCAGAIVKLKHPGCDLYPVNYGRPFPWELFTDMDQVVYMVDFCLEPFDQMERLNSLCELHWIDHHKSAIKHANEHMFCPSGGISLRDGLAGCELTWDYCHATEEPLAVRLAGRYDVWDHSDPRVLPFQYWLRSWDMDPRTTLSLTLWGLLFEDVNRVQDAVLNGEAILRYVHQHDAIYAGACFETELDGLRCLAVNRMYANSNMFESVYNPEHHDCMLTFGWRHGVWNISLYADKPDVDVSIIAEAHGGGGHKGASGFQCDELPFELR